MRAISAARVRELKRIRAVHQWARWIGLRPVDGLNMADTVMIGILLALNIVIWAGEIVHGAYVPVLFMMMAGGILPVVLLAIRRVAASLILALVGLPCFWAATTYCDMSPDRTWGVLHASHDWLALLMPYAGLRVVVQIMRKLYTR